MAIRKIVLFDTPDGEVLSKVCKPVEKFDDKLAVLLDDLNDTLSQAEGLGLAAPQVGILKRVAVVNYDGQHFELVNPTIVKTSGSSVDDEGCLSVEGIRGLVKRPDYIKVEYFDRNGQKQLVEADGYFARVFFHEIDHLDGIVFVDKIIKNKKGRPVTFEEFFQQQQNKDRKKTDEGKK